MKNLIFATLLFLILGCKSNSTDKKEKNVTESISACQVQELAMDYSAEFSPPPPPSDISDMDLIPQKIIKEASIKFKVENYFKARKGIDSVITKYHALISRENESQSTSQISNTLMIRIENKFFEKFIGEISSIARKFDSKIISANDVTEDFVDLSARLKTKKEFEQRYLQILNKANKVEDILQIENEIRTIREEIESTQGRLNYLNNKVDYSTITLSIYQNYDYKYEPEVRPNFIQKSFESLNSGWKIIVNIFLWILSIWPIVLLLILSWCVYRLYNRRKKGTSRK
jgi:hypothetical protein